MRAGLLYLILLLSACSQKDLAGRELSAVEEQALDTCNNWLDSKMRGTLVSIRSEEAVFRQNGPAQLDIAWQAATPAGQGVVVCSTDQTGSSVRGALVDGVQVQP